jgi:hypothetical protein
MSMMKVMCRLGLVLFTIVATPHGQSPVAAAQANSTEGVRGSQLSRLRGLILVDTIAAIQQGIWHAPKKRSDATTRRGNGIEVYINVPQQGALSAAGLELQAKISTALDAPQPDMSALLSDAQLMLAKYDEAIEVVAKAPPLNPIYDELAACGCPSSPARGPIRP